MEEMMQRAPFPHELADLVSKLTYRPGWNISLKHMVRDREDPADDDSAAIAEGLTLDITTHGYNSYHPENGQYYRVHHYMIVPAATYTRESWMRWLLEMFFLVERHEACEFFTLDGEKPYAPHHGPGEDPYIVWHHGTDDQRRISFRGKVNP